MLAEIRDPLLSPRDAAERLHVTPQTLRRWAETGKIDHTRTAGGARRYPESEIRRLERRRGGQA
jgi:excisionase family DNA binding protein